MINIIEPLRHMSVFSPHKFGNRRIDIIGVGATGSRIALSLAKLGIVNIHLWDFDKVEAHNIANQAYSQSHIDATKVEAAAEIIKAATELDVNIHNIKVDGSETMGEIVFLLTDTMESRKQIWNGTLKYKLRTNLLIETRMGADCGRVYALNPNKPAQIKAWEETLCDDSEAEVTICGTSISVGPTAEIISGLAVWQLIKWFSIEQGGGDGFDNEIIFSLRPFTVITRQF